MVINKIQLMVSVCIISYNHADCIAMCIDSVLAQKTTFKFEVIIADDASTDGTVEILKSYAENYPDLIKLILHNKNIGGCANYRSSHNAASGKYIAQLDGDDYWLPSKLQQQVDLLEKNSELIASFTNAIIVDVNNSFLGLFNSKFKNVISKKDLLSRGSFLNQSSFVYRSIFRNSLNNLSEVFIDYEFYLFLSRHGSFGYIDQPLVSYRRNNASSITLNFPDKILNLYWQVFQLMPENEIKFAVGSLSRFWMSVIISSVKNKTAFSIFGWGKKIYYRVRFCSILVFGLGFVFLMQRVCLVGLQFISKIMRGNMYRSIY